MTQILLTLIEFIYGENKPAQCWTPVLKADLQSWNFNYKLCISWLKLQAFIENV